MMIKRTIDKEIQRNGADIKIYSPALQMRLFTRGIVNAYDKNATGARRYIHMNTRRRNGSALGFTDADSLTVFLPYHEIWETPEARQIFVEVFGRLYLVTGHTVVPFGNRPVYVQAFIGLYDEVVDDYSDIDVVTEEEQE